MHTLENNLIKNKNQNKQAGAIPALLVLVGLGVIALGTIVAGKLVQQGPRDLPKAAEPKKSIGLQGFGISGAPPDPLLSFTPTPSVSRTPTPTINRTLTPSLTPTSNPNYSPTPTTYSIGCVDNGGRCINSDTCRINGGACKINLQCPVGTCCCFDAPTASPYLSPTVTPTVTRTPTPTWTPTPTATPSPYVYNGHYWYFAQPRESCTQACIKVGKICFEDNWNDTTSCSISRSMTGDTTRACQPNTGNFAPFRYDVPSENYYQFTYRTIRSTALCDAVYSGDYARRLCACLDGIPPNTPTPTPTRVVSITPTPTLTVVPTPPSNEDLYLLDVGTKSSLTIRIGAGETPQIRFRAKLAHTQNNPEMYMRLRVKDELAFIDNPGGTDTCDSAGTGAKDLYVPMKADSNGVYMPTSQISASPPPAGSVIAQVSADGYVMLDGVLAGRYQSFILKAPKTRGSLMLEHTILVAGNSSSQDYDWTSQPLEPGDLPDPNRNMLQDCTVNSIDLTLIETRLAATDPTSLIIADVNYDGVVNGNDISKVVNTLSTKPDDDL